MKSGDALFKAIEPVRVVFKATKRELEKLPPSRMRSLALTDLEMSFTRATFAASALHDPIEAED